MKIIVDAFPTTAAECPFSAKGTGKWRCRWNALLCPINRDAECPYLIAQSSVIVTAVPAVEAVPDPNAVVGKAVSKTRSRKKA